MFENIEEIFGKTGLYYVKQAVSMALAEDEKDLTSDGIFSKDDMSYGKLISREDTYIVGLPIIPLILEEMGIKDIDNVCTLYAKDGDFLPNNQKAAEFHLPTAVLLKAERIILNFITHLSGIANLTKKYMDELEGTGVRLTDTRKTIPCLRYLEKYAVRAIGATNHRMHLSDALMIKNNHIDAAGSIVKAVEKLRQAYGSSCPPIIVECRDTNEILEAVSTKPTRILLDNMDIPTLNQNLPLIPKEIEAEISGGVSLETIRALALASKERPADFISVGRITHSAPMADFSLRINRIAE